LRDVLRAGRDMLAKEARLCQENLQCNALRHALCLERADAFGLAT